MKCLVETGCGDIGITEISQSCTGRIVVGCGPEGVLAGNRNLGALRCAARIDAPRLICRPEHLHLSIVKISGYVIGDPLGICVAIGVRRGRAADRLSIRGQERGITPDKRDQDRAVKNRDSKSAAHAFCSLVAALRGRPCRCLPRS